MLGSSQADAAPSLSGVKSTYQNTVSSTSCKPSKAFLLSFEAATFLLSLSVLSPCASLSGVQPTAFPHQKLTFPVIEVLDRFPILFTFCAPILSRKENVNEQELNETHKPGEFVSEGMGEGTEGDRKMKTLTSAKSDMYWHLQIKLSNHEILSLENKIHIQNPNQNIFSPVYKICF